MKTSRILRKVPDGHATITLTIDDSLLAWLKFNMREYRQKQIEGLMFELRDVIEDMVDHYSNNPRDADGKQLL